MSLPYKLFGAFMTFIIVPLIALGFALYILVTNMIEEKYSGQAELTLRALTQSVGFVFGEMNKVTDSTIASDAIQEMLNNGYETDLKEIDYLDLNKVQRNFRDLLINHPSVSYAFMYTLNNERINRIFTKEHFQAMPFAQFKKQEIYQQVLDRKGQPVWVGPYEYPELTGVDPVFTQIRVVKDIATLNDKGILLVQIKNSGIESVFRYFRYKQKQSTTEFLIVNGKGLIMYDSSEKLNGKFIDQYVRKPLVLDTTYRSGRGKFDGQDSVISSIGAGIEKEDWHLVSITSWKSLSSEVGLYSRWVVGILLFCVLSACYFIMFFANRIAKSILQTVKFMRRVERGDLNARLPIKGNDETALLARGFNSLVSQVSELLTEVKSEQERKRHAELQALQAQIKPHFLFNALESINVLAVQNQGKKVSQMVTRLGSLLRISITQREQITVEQELDHLLSYLGIQKFRFEDLFDFEIDIPPGLMRYEMLKLTLQPLVENCIQHGFEGIDYMGHIRVSAREEGDSLAFYIEDNGIGISPERLQVFNYDRQMKDSRHEDSPQTGEARGLGVYNVADRIRIQYGSRYGLFICSEQGRGTTMKFTIPKKDTGSVAHEIEGAAD